MPSIKISVIMPVFNAEKWLGRAINCIIDQTYSNIELILINDGSTDGSDIICEEYAKRDNRIIYYSQENHGQGYTRSLGVEMATGDYIAFFDDDDRCDRRMYETMVNAALSNNADICVCQWNYELPDGTHTVNNQIYDASFYGVMNSIEFARYLYKYEGKEDGYGYANGIVVSPWNKIFHKDVIKGVKCSGYLGEDEEMNDWINCKNVKVVIIPDEFYYWCHHSSSMSHKPFSSKKYHFLEMLVKRCERFNDTYILEKTRFLFCNLFIEYWYYAEEANIEPPKQLYSTFIEMYTQLLKDRKCNIKFVLRALIFRCSKALYKHTILKK